MHDQRQRERRVAEGLDPGDFVPTLLFGPFALLCVRAHAKQRELALTPPEVFEVKAFAGHHLVSAGVGVVAVLIAVAGPAQFARLSPSSFALVGPGHFIMAGIVEHRRQLRFGAQPTAA